MSAVKQCTPAEIAEKRRIAEERQKLNKLKRKSEINNNRNTMNFPLASIQNRFVLNPQQLKAMNNGTRTEASTLNSGLTEEQKAKIEHNRQEAIKRKLAKKLISDQAATELLSKKTSPVSTLSTPPTSFKPLNQAQGESIMSSGRSTVASLNLNQVQLSGKSTPPSKTIISGPRVKPYEQRSIFDASKKSVGCKVEFIKEDRFVVRMDRYNELVINEFRKIQSKSFDQTTKDWSFNIADYDILMKLIGDLANEKLAVFLERIPDFAMKLLKMETPLVNESCLEAMKPEIVNELFDYQKTAVAYGISKGGRFLLADDMGLGKTREALAIAHFYENDWPLLIVTTASSRTVWSNEIMAFMPHVNVYNIRTVESHNDNILDAKVVICSYTAMENNMAKLEQMNFGVVIFDESHALKNSQAKQTSNATKLGHKASRAILVTGTPALSAPVELYTQLHIIKKNFASYSAFTTRYCDGKRDRFGWKATGCTYPKELEIILKKHFMIRRTKAEVYGCLGGKTRERVELARCSSKGMKVFADDYNNAAGRKDRQNEILIQWYVETAEKKKDDVCRYLEAKLKETDEKILIFAAHHCVLDAVSDSLAKNGVRYVRIDGKTNSKTRSENVASFQRDPSIRCAVLSILACKEGITLTSASIVIFAELDWTPSNILQAEGRVHRIGQTMPVKVFYLISPGTADDIIWRKLEEKQFHLNSLGLSTKNEHLGLNTESTFQPSSTSISGSTPSKRITEYFAVDSSKPSNSPEIYYTCENSFVGEEILENDASKPETFQKSSKTAAGQYHDSQEDCDIDLQELLEVEKKAAVCVSASTSKGMSASMEFHKRKNFLGNATPKFSADSNDSDIDLQALMEAEKIAAKVPTNTQKIIQSELEGVIFDDDEEDELLSCITKQ